MSDAVVISALGAQHRDHASRNRHCCHVENGQFCGLIQRRAGPKGFGLFTNQALKAGQFIIEYVGEVSCDTPLWDLRNAHGRGLGSCSSVAIIASEGLLVLYTAVAEGERGRGGGVLGGW